ncbi:MAG: hypothetical protein ACQETJ_06530 [Bacteroidota bacterium]
MKTTLLVTVFAFIASAAFASGNLKVNMEQTASEETVVEASNVESKLFEIEFRDSYGDRFFTKKTTDDSFTYKRKYNLSTLDDGTYFMTVKHGDEKYQKEFKVRSGDLEVVSQRKVVEPHFKVEGDMVKLSYLNYPNDKMSIAVFDKGELLHEEKIDTQFAVHKAIDLSELRNGNYRVVFASGFDIFEYDIALKQ